LQIEQTYDVWAQQYDSCENPTRDLEKQVAQEYYANVQMNEVLEIGCGTGLNTALLTEKAEKVIALDFSIKMLEKAREKFKDKPVIFVQTDLLLDWPIKGDSVDFVSCSLVLEHIENIKPVFQKSFAALRPGGHLYICEFHPVKQFAGSKPRFELDGEIIKVPAYLHRFTDYASAATKAGFEIIKFDNHFDLNPKPKNENIPRLISFLFKKP